MFVFVFAWDREGNVFFASDRIILLSYYVEVCVVFWAFSCRFGAQSAWRLGVIKKYLGQ